jgi:hypothetical protein
MHLHDPGRLKAATDATEIAKEFGGKGTAVFEPMEENLDAFTTIEQEVARLANEHERETFFAVVATYTADELADELADTMHDWTNNIEEFNRVEQWAIEGVNAALQRGELAKALLRMESGPDQDCLDELESTPSTESIDKLLCRLQRRLKQMQKSANQFIKIFDKVSGLLRDQGSESSAAGVVTKMEGTEEEKTAIVSNWIDAASDAVDERDRSFSATRTGWSKGSGVCDDFMKLRLSSSGCETRPARGEPTRVGSEPCDGSGNAPGDA